MMKYALLFLLFFPLRLDAQNTDQGCSIWRRNVKILADLDQVQIDNLLNALPRTVTVKQLNDDTLVLNGEQVELTNGEKWENVPRQPSENYTVLVTGKVIACGKEENDKDYHIVLQDLNSGELIVAEIPDPDCADITNIMTQRRFRGLRTWFNDNVETPGTGVKPLENFVTITIIGVPFWDGKHPGSVHGAAKNFREIHPVLKFVTRSGQEIPPPNYMSPPQER